jgi:Cd(II)/Pb(II)-responsive transcriptional regulator
MKIGELAKLTHTSVETIRYYEKSGLMPEPVRTANNYRTYSQLHIDRLRFIRNCRALDLSHEEIWALLKLAEHPQENCEAADVVNEHIKHVQARIAELKQLEEKLLLLKDQCCDVTGHASCGIFEVLISQEIDEVQSVPHTHGKHDFSHR